MSPRTTTPKIYCGVDTPADTHHAAIVIDTGVFLDSHQFDSTAIGYHDLEAWIIEHGYLRLPLVSKAPPPTAPASPVTYSGAASRSWRYPDRTANSDATAARAIRSMPKPPAQCLPATNSPNPDTATGPSNRSVHSASPDPARSKPRPSR